MGVTASSPAVPSALSSSFSVLTGTSSSPTYQRSWMTSFARSSLVAFLQKAIHIGYLELHDQGEVLSFGRCLSGCNNVRLVIANDNFWQRVFHAGDLGFSEAYMMGDVHVIGDDLTSVMNLWLDNESTMTGMSSTLHRIATTLSGWTNSLFGQTLSRARLNAIASYDQSNDLFRAFLSEEMMYSCALWGPEEGGVRGDVDFQPSTSTSPASSTGTLVCEPTWQANALESAQARKIDHVLAALRLRPGMRLLEFGSGWGALAIRAAQKYGVEVDTLTLSVEQKRLAEERIHAAGLVGRVRVHLMDYRETPSSWDGLFDAFVSVEMLEHVGTQYYKTYFAIVDRALKKSGATAVVTSSTFPEARYTTRQTEDFMRRYMWPNSCLPSATVLINAAQEGSNGRFTLEGVENHAAHYIRTLREWGRRLEVRLTPSALGLSSAPSSTTSTAVSSPCEKKDIMFKHISSACTSTRSGVSDSQREATLLQTLPAAPSADEAAFEALKRKWQYLFAYAGAGFSKGYITCHMLTFIRPSDGPTA